MTTPYGVLALIPKQVSGSRVERIQAENRMLAAHCRERLYDNAVLCNNHSL